MCPCRAFFVFVFFVLLFRQTFGFLYFFVLRPFIMQDFLRFKNAPFLPHLFVTSFFNFLGTTVESYARLHVKTSISLFRIIRIPRVPRTSYYIRYRYHVPGTYSKQQFAAGNPTVLLYEKGDAVRIEPRPPSPNTCASARAARGRCFDPKPAATAPGCRACSASPDRASCRLSINNRAGSSSGSQQQQCQGLVDNS